MKLTVARSPTSSCKKIRSNLLLKGANVSISTISSRLNKEFGLKSYKPAKKPRLTSQIKKKRLEFARKQVDWSVPNWKKVLFSDKSTFQHFTIRKNHVRPPVRKRFNAKYTIFTVNHPEPKRYGGHECYWYGWYLFLEA